MNIQDGFLLSQTTDSVCDDFKHMKYMVTDTIAQKFLTDLIILFVDYRHPDVSKILFNVFFLFKIPLKFAFETSTTTNCF